MRRVNAGDPYPQEVSFSPLFLPCAVGVDTTCEDNFFKNIYIYIVLLFVYSGGSDRGSCYEVVGGEGRRQSLHLVLAV